MDLGDLDKIIAKVASAKGLALLIVIGIVAFFVYRNFDFVSKVTFEIAPNLAEKKRDAANRSPVVPSDLQFRRLQMPPVQTGLPPYIFAELRNGRDVAARNVEFALDLGTATIERVSVRPSDRCQAVSADASSLIRVRCESVGGYESVYVHAVVTAAQLRGAVASVNGVSGHMSIPSIDGPPEFDVSLWDGILFLLKWAAWITFAIVVAIVAFSIISIAFGWGVALSDRLTANARKGNRGGEA